MKKILSCLVILCVGLAIGQYMVQANGTPPQAIQSLASQIFQRARHIVAGLTPNSSPRLLQAADKFNEAKDEFDQCQKTKGECEQPESFLYRASLGVLSAAASTAYSSASAVASYGAQAIGFGASQEQQLMQKFNPGERLLVEVILNKIREHGGLSLEVFKGSPPFPWGENTHTLEQCLHFILEKESHEERIDLLERLEFRINERLQELALSQEPEVEALTLTKEENEIMLEILKMVGPKGSLFELLQNPFAPDWGVKYTVGQRFEKILKSDNRAERMRWLLRLQDEVREQIALEHSLKKIEQIEREAQE